MLVAVHDPRHDRVRIGARADYEKKDEEKGLEIEKGRLDIRLVSSFLW